MYSCASCALSNTRDTTHSDILCNQFLYICLMPKGVRSNQSVSVKRSGVSDVSIDRIMPIERAECPLTHL